MSVKINNLSKIYGNRKALDGISFSASSGEVTGFLGPNGAGKSTTMKILSGYIRQDDGQAEVCGFDTSTHSEDVRKIIGYLPEHNPLYKDMYVQEYLRFVAGLHQLSNKSTRVKDMIELTGLGREQHKKIGSLSKGYRQRVGLAQAMIHNPKVLILDEPTSGLDPNQLADIRRLIIDLGKEKTVILSTHIMQEVEAVCDKVVIINKGEIVANGALQDLKNQGKGNTVEIAVEFNKVADLSSFEEMENVHSARKGENPNQWLISTDVKLDLRPDIFRFAVENQLILLEMTRKKYEVEDIFRQLTK
ncbi:MAG: gliding motility-associated ABC transporter ATP-binding subunit GldA [Saprospiraceae bacterium]